MRPLRYYLNGGTLSPFSAEAAQSLCGSIEKLRILTHLAGVLHLNGKREATETDFRTAVKHTAVPFLDKWQVVLAELVRAGVLAAAGDRFVFGHMSFQEYLAAKHLMDPTGQRSSQALRHFLRGDDWWRGVTEFFIGMAGDPSRVEHWINQTTKGCIARSENIIRGDINSRREHLLHILAVSYPSHTLAARSI